MFPSGSSTLSPPTMKLTDNEKKDYFKWYLDEPEAGFSPKRNKAVIEQSIIKSKLLRERRNRDYIESIRERSDAVVSYLKHVDMGHEQSVERYFGRKMLAHLRGQKIVEEIKGRTKRLLSLD